MPRPTTRDDVLRAAADLFARRGYRGTSIADIAHEAGCSKASVLYHAASKEGLLAALLDPALADLAATRARLDDEGLDRSTQRADWLSAVVDLVLAHRGVVAILHSEAAHLLADPDGDAAGLRPVVDEMIGRLAGGDVTALDPLDLIAPVIVLAGFAALASELPDVPHDRLRAELIRVGTRTLSLT